MKLLVLKSLIFFLFQWNFVQELGAMGPQELGATEPFQMSKEKLKSRNPEVEKQVGLNLLTKGKKKLTVEEIIKYAKDIGVQAIAVGLDKTVTSHGATTKYSVNDLVSLSTKAINQNMFFFIVTFNNPHWLDLRERGVKATKAYGYSQLLDKVPTTKSELLKGICRDYKLLPSQILLIDDSPLTVRDAIKEKYCGLWSDSFFGFFAAAIHDVNDDVVKYQNPLLRDDPNLVTPASGEISQEFLKTTRGKRMALNKFITGKAKIGAKEFVQHVKGMGVKRVALSLDAHIKGKDQQNQPWSKVTPDLLSLLGEAKTQGVDVCIVTHNDVTQVREYLKKEGVKLNFIYGYRLKPHKKKREGKTPLLFRARGLRDIHLIPAEILVIDDSLSSVETAVNKGYFGLRAGDLTGFRFKSLLPVEVI